MKAKAKCFIKNDNGQYYDITYEKLCQCCELEPEIYAKKKFFPIQGMLLEVTSEEYKSLYKDYERQKYLKKLDDYFSPLQLDEYGNDKNMFIGADVDISKIIETRMFLDALENALKQLNLQERFLINEIFFEDKTDAELARETGVPRTTLNSRKKRVLKKLKKLIEKQTTHELKKI
ncbi:MAG: sigma factor-like helix-turn-helix DNA-binding protein [Eubacterium sp.]